MSCSNRTTIWVCEGSVKQLVHVKVIVQLPHGIIEGDVNDLDIKNHKSLDNSKHNVKIFPWLVPLPNTSDILT